MYKIEILKFSYSAFMNIVLTINHSFHNKNKPGGSASVFQEITEIYTKQNLTRTDTVDAPISSSINIQDPM